MPMWQREMEVARQAARAGGEVVKRYYRQGVAMRAKESYNLVSDADVESERTMLQRRLPPDDFAKST